MGHIQIDLSFPREEKLRQLARDLGIPVVYAAAHVSWLWMAVMEKPENRFDGNMDGWTHEVIADFAAWPGDAEKFVTALLQCGRPKKRGLIEERDGVLYLHEWKKWQGPGLLNKMEYERKARLDKATLNEATKGSQRAPAATGDDTVVKSLMDAMKAANVTGPASIKREHIAAWRTRGIVERAHSLIMGEGKGLDIFSIAKMLNGNAKAVAEDPVAAIRRKFLGEESKK